MRLTGALLALSCLALAGCQTRPDPPSAVEVKVAVPVPCAVPEPQCSAPAYNAAKKEQPACCAPRRSAKRIVCGATAKRWRLVGELSYR